MEKLCSMHGSQDQKAIKQSKPSSKGHLLNYRLLFGWLSRSACQDIGLIRAQREKKVAKAQRFATIYILTDTPNIF
jgi:hypothetical protein